MVTTDGAALAATAVMTLTLSVLLTVMFWGVEVEEEIWLPWLEEIAHAATPAPETPPTRAPTASAATRPTLLERLAVEGAAVVGAVGSSGCVTVGATYCSSVAARPESSGVVSAWALSRVSDSGRESGVSDPEIGCCDASVMGAAPSKRC